MDELLLTTKEVDAVMYGEWLSARPEFKVLEPFLKAQLAKVSSEIEKAYARGFEQGKFESQEKIREIWEEIICPMCYRLNPQHKSMDYGEGCHWCQEKEDWCG